MISIVLGLGFGDEGKGSVVNSLITKAKGSPENTIVVRFSGGQQAGHTVMHEGIKHIHASYGSGALRGFPTYITEHCTIDPTAIFNEQEILKEKTGQIPRIYVDPEVKVTTPFDVLKNREQSYKNSCGMGIGTTMHRALTSGYQLKAMDLMYPEIVKAKLRAIGEEYYKYSKYRVNTLITHFMETLDKVKNLLIEFPYVIDNYQNIVFEGSQGIMLDKDHGVFPNVTYANTTSKNAIEVIKQLGLLAEPNFSTYYVTRSYLTRHGMGWMPNEDPIELKNLESETNLKNHFQGALRYGKLDIPTLDYAVKCDKLFNGSDRYRLVVTCTDQYDESLEDLKEFSNKFDSIHYSENPAGPIL